ncbi:unnamed protein product [Brassica rapa subsp. narinosa]
MRELEHLKTTMNHPWPLIGAPVNHRREEPSTAILISMFLVIAVCEKTIRRINNKFYTFRVVKNALSNHKKR